MWFTQNLLFMLLASLVIFSFSNRQLLLAIPNYFHQINWSFIFTVDTRGSIQCSFDKIHNVVHTESIFHVACMIGYFQFQTNNYFYLHQIIFTKLIDHLYLLQTPEDQFHVVVIKVIMWYTQNLLFMLLAWLVIFIFKTNNYLYLHQIIFTK